MNNYKTQQVLQQHMGYEKELAFAKEIATKAGEMILDLANKEVAIKNKSPEDQVTNVDLAVDVFVREQITKSFPQDSILSEEAPFEKKGRRVWVVDPLDGTCEFIAYLKDKNEPRYFAVLIGLLEDNKPVLGVTYVPQTKELFFAAKDLGAWCTKEKETLKLQASKTENISDATIGMSPRRPQGEAFAKRCGFKEIQHIPCIGVRLCRIAAGELDCSVSIHSKAHLWDTCAGHVLITEAGGKITNKDGSRLAYNPQNTAHQNGIIATNGSLEIQYKEK